MRYGIVKDKDIEIAYENVLGANNEFMKQTKEYGWKDALFAVVLYIFEILGLLIVGELFLLKGDVSAETYLFIATGIFSISIIGLVFLFCIIRKQKLSTIGFSKTQAKKSFIVGMILFGFVAIGSSIKVMFFGSVIQTDINLIIIKFIFFLIFIAFMEELLNRAYIGTRLFGFFKNKKLSLVIVGIMCSLSHVPYYMIISQVSLSEYISSNFISLISFTIIHIFFQWLYAKYNSIIAPTILHFIWDYVQWFII